MSNSGCDMKAPGEGHGTTYTLRIHISSACQEEQKLDFYEAPCIAVRGQESICLVIRKMPEDNPEKPDLLKVFPDPFCKPVAIVSVITTTPGVKCGIKDIRALAAICNVTEASNFLEKIFETCLPFTYKETVQIAISAFHELIPGGFKANEMEIFVVKWEEKITRALPNKEIKVLLDGSNKATKKFNRLFSLSSYHYREKVIPRFAETEIMMFGGCHYRKESCDEGMEKTYHRRTNVYDGYHSTSIVKSPGPTWIGVQGQEALCGVNRVTALGKPEKPDLMKIFRRPSNKAIVDACAIVSVAFDAYEVQDGSDTAVSVDEDDEETTINFLETAFCKHPTFTWEETVQTAISALRCLYGGNLKANEIEIFLARKGNKITTAFPVHEIKSLFDINCKKAESLCPVFLLYSEETSCEESRSIYYRETQIRCGGWDSQMLESSGFSWSAGCSWISVQGKDSKCVVTKDEFELGQGFSDVLHHMIAIQLLDKKVYADDMSKKSSVAAVSVVVGFDEVHEASSAEIRTAEFLMKRINEVSDFTFEVTVQTAISALLCLTQNNLKASEIKACVARVGAYIRLLTEDEIEKHLEVITKHLTGEDSASKRTRRF